MYINQICRYAIKLLFLLSLVIFILAITSKASEISYPRVLDYPWDHSHYPWDHSSITVYIDNKSVPPHYSLTYYSDVKKALNYWAGGGNGKLKYIPIFEIEDSEDADIRIRWDANLQKDQGAPQEVAGETIQRGANGRFVSVDITLGVGNSQWMELVPYSDTAMLVIAEHELGHALGLDHSNDPQDIMYPSNEQIDNTNPFLQGKYGSLLLIEFYTAIVVIVFIYVSWLLNK